MTPPEQDLTATRSVADGSEPTAGSRAYLLVLENDRSRMFYLPRHGAVLVGRVPEAELQIEDTSVSRRHARFAIADGEISVSDLGSYNGTVVNGERIPGACVLSSGDVVAIGEVLLILQRSSRGSKTARRFMSFPSLRQRLSEEVERAQRYQRVFSVLGIQLSPTSTPTTPGREELEPAIAAALRPIDSAAWQGDREAWLVLPELGPAAARQLAIELNESLPRGAAARVGLATCPLDGGDAEALLGAARAAMLAAPVGGVCRAAEAATHLRMGDREIVLADPAMLSVFELLKRLAKSDLPVLVRGETGTGKENAAYAVHYFSSRSQRPFVAVNCAAIAETLIESELFGHEKGAFSGADKSKPGLLESAQGGTVFLDEVGELSASAQSKLLRALETRRITRVGDVREREIDLRVVAATHRDLEAEIAAGRFRQDLFFRLGAATVILPPLRERPREIALLSETFLRSACERLGRAPMSLHAATLHVLSVCRWPGNVRELRNLMDYLAAAIIEDVVVPAHLPRSISGLPAAAAAEAPLPSAAAPQVASPATSSATKPAAEEAPAHRSFRPIAEEIRDLERTRMLEALETSGGVRKVAAELIGMPLRTFTLKLKQYGLGRGGTIDEPGDD